MSALDDLLQMLRFGAVGLVATLVHFVVALAVGSIVGMSSVQLANTVGFLVALLVSFLGHYHFTFASSELYTRAFAKFAIVAFLCFSTSSLSIFLAGYAHLPSMVQLSIGVAIIPLLSYVANKKLVF